jgi:hypothetical protein
VFFACQAKKYPNSRNDEKSFGRSAVARPRMTWSDVKDYPFRVLMVMKTSERRNNTAERLLNNNPPIFSQVCLSTLSEVCADPLGAVWIQPKDYRAAVNGTPFDTTRRIPAFGYRRQSERESLIETKIQKFRLLEN